MKVITFGVFDFFHFGHLKLFEQAKKHGDYLIVAVQDESAILKYKPNAKILYSTSQRIEIIKSLRIVDEVIVYCDLDNDIKNIDFDVLALGEDHVGERFQKAVDFCNLNNKKVVRLKRTPLISSSDIKKNL